MTSPKPRGLLVARLEAGKVYADFKVFTEDGSVTYSRYVGPASPAAPERQASYHHQLTDAIIAVGPEITRDELLELAARWERGELDVH